MKQMGFSSADPGARKKITRRERFLAVMQQVVPWERLAAAAEPHWPRAREGSRERSPFAVPSLLRLYFVQRWYALADDALEDALHDSDALRRFVGIDLATESVPDAATVLDFRRLLESHSLLLALLGEIDAHLRQQGLLMKRGSMVEAAIVAAESVPPPGRRR